MSEKQIYENWEMMPKSYKDDMVQFQNWFDETTSIKHTIAQGHIDFHNKVVTNEVYRILGDIKDKSCLEIGFGGGRLLNAASQVFSKAYGIDIHSCFDTTNEFLKSQNCNNHQLVHYSDTNSLPDNFIDFVYSFIVFQHFSSISYFHDYIRLIKRILKRGGCANLHLAKNIWNDNDYYLKDDLISGTTNSTLFYSPSFVKKVLNDSNFEVVSEGQMTKSPWSTNLSGQFYVIFKHKE